MNILITIYRGLGYGGAEVSTKLLAEGLTKLGNKVIIASSDEYYGIDTKKFKKFDRIPVFRFQEAYLSRFLSKIIKEEKIDLIYAHDRLTSIPAILAAKKNKIKSIVHFRDYWFACPYSNCLAPDNFEYDKCDLRIILKHFKAKRWLIDLYKLIYLKRARKILITADLKFALSEAVKKRLEINNIKDSRIITSARKFHDFDGNKENIKRKYNLKKKVITFIGSLIYPKGIMNMIKIMPEILNENISFLIVGDGPLLEEIRNKNIPGIVLTGRLKAEEMPDVYAASDLILLPSVWQEPFSGILHEAAAAKKAILASNTGGSRDAMTEEELIEANNLGEWKKRIKELITNDRLREKLALDYAKRSRKNYDVDIVAKKVNEIFENL
ncbi:glycosyltransferase family 4 protein [Candidatus Woesearchaeota archaeon]|nr:glycosyltransferase family 4 protein [Candidatus Woesearchaeota archaeon]